MTALSERASERARSAGDVNFFVPQNVFHDHLLYQFHIRVYCVAAGDLTVYLYTRMLALFSSKPFALPAPLPTPTPGDTATIDLAPHLTNSSLLQASRRGEGSDSEGIRLLDELVGCHILSRGASAGASATGPSASNLLPGSDDPDSTLTSAHVANIQDQIADALAETFTAGLQSPIHFQVRSFSSSWYAINICLLRSPAAAAA